MQFKKPIAKNKNQADKKGKNFKKSQLKLVSQLKQHQALTL